MQQLDASSYRAAVERDLASRQVVPAPAAGAAACAACGTTNDGDARFCKQCGAALARLA
jgi:hypothetical protein